MAGRKAPRGVPSRDRWAAQIAGLDGTPDAPRSRREPITVARIVAAALQVVETEGFDALTMRRVAAVLPASPGALYAHVRDKSELDDLMIGELCSRVALPAPDRQHWQEQALDVCAQLRDQYLRYPGISRAAFAVAPTNQDTLRVSEGMLAILLAGGIEPQAAAWAVDSLLLYVSAYSLEISLVNQRRSHQDGSWIVSRDELLRRFAALPDTFPQSKRYAAELTAGTGHDRFDFTIGLMIDGLADRLSRRIRASRKKRCILTHQNCRNAQNLRNNGGLGRWWPASAA
jgi:AcrR family transcriptional regulator